MHNDTNLNHIDPLRLMAEKQSEKKEYSPMDPPDAYSPPGMQPVDYEQMHPFLQKFMDEHKVSLEKLGRFETALIEIQQQGVSRKADRELRDFFEFFDQKIAVHNLREERILFPLLKQRLISSGEHAASDTLHTGVDLLEDDHIKALQLAAVVFNFFALSSRLPDEASRLMVMDAAIEQGKGLVEMLKLHIFREDNIVFAQADKLLTKEELDHMAQQTV